MSSKLMRGTFILTLGTYISKFLGLFYIIPFFALVGENGTALYNYGYVPYSIFISIANAGLPAAVAKYISKYNAMEEYAVGRRLFKSGLVLMLVTGFAAFFFLYMLAPLLADIIVVNEEQVTNTSDVVAVIRAVSFALIIVPFMSIIRGFFQGHQSMGPSAVSQVVEQVVRIAFLLSGAFIIMKILSGEVVEAVKVATFAAFVGALGGIAVLFWYWAKRKPYLDQLLLKDRGQLEISLRQIYKEIFISAIPFVLVGISIPMYQMVDTLTHNKAMSAIGLATIADANLGILNVQSHKIVIIPVSLATAFSITLVPLITNAFISQNIKELKTQVNQTFQILLFLTLPAAVGIGLLAEPIYTVFYGHDDIGAGMLAAYAPVAILFALFSVTAAVLQGINEQRFTVFSLLLGLLIKLILNPIFIEAYQTTGAIYATVIGYTVAILINLGVIKYYAHFRFKMIFRRSILMLIFNLIMAGVVYLLYNFTTLFLSTESKFQSILIIGICASVGAALYFYLSTKTKLFHFLFPEITKKLKRKFARG